LFSLVLNVVISGRKAITPVACLLLFCLCAGPFVQGREKQKETYNQGYSTEIAAPIDQVLEAVEFVVADGIIEGTKEYDKDKFISGATPENKSPLFAAWNGPGKTFYKVRTQALAPRNFKESADQGTLAVRYVVQQKDASRTILRIDAVFVEDYRHAVHPSNGTVELSEYKDIQDQIDAIQQKQRQAQEAEKHREQELARQALQRRQEAEEATALSTSSTESVEQRVQDLRRQLERVVKAPGAPLKSAPFQSATTLKALNTGTEIVILISTTYWYGIETQDGQRGWVRRAQLEPIP